MNNEYIRREEAVDVFNRAVQDVGILDADDIETVFGMLSSADVAPVVHAHWIQTSAEDENGNAYYYCSNCGRGESHNPIVEVPYCWKCGAKMDAQEEE